MMVMNIKIERSFALDVAATELRARLLAWAERAGFRFVEESPGRWLFRRGSQLHALYSFDIRKIPTVLEVKHLPAAGKVAVSLICGSWSQLLTSSDRDKLENETATLFAWLCDADAPRSDGRRKASADDRYSPPRDEIEPA
jgi:hypothetical protein